MTHNTQTKQIHKAYCEEYDSTISYSTFYKILCDLNTAVSDWLLEGEHNTLNMKSHMGTICIYRFKRKFKLDKNGIPRLPVDWGATNKLWKEQPEFYKKKLIFHVDPWYCGFYWHRWKCKVPGRTAYGFEPSRSNGVQSKVGNKNKLVSLLHSSDTYYLRFPLYDL